MGEGAVVVCGWTCCRELQPLGNCERSSDNRGGKRQKNDTVVADFAKFASILRPP